MNLDRGKICQIPISTNPEPKCVNQRSILHRPVQGLEFMNLDCDMRLQAFGLNAVANVKI